MSYGVPVAEELFSTRVAKKIPSARIVVPPFLFLSCAALHGYQQLWITLFVTISYTFFQAFKALA
jgi:hypothetical protein